jgi:hypothetical protein
MCKLLNSKNENVSGIPCEYLNSQFGANLRNFHFQIVDWAIPDIQFECEKLTLKEGYYYFKIKICNRVTCDDVIRVDIESRYFGIQTQLTENSFREVVGKIVSFDCLETNMHKLKMIIQEDLPSEDFSQCGFV